MEKNKISRCNQHSMKQAAMNEPSMNEPSMNEPNVNELEMYDDDGEQEWDGLPIGVYECDETPNPYSLEAIEAQLKCKKAEAEKNIAIYERLLKDWKEKLNDIITGNLTIDELFDYDSDEPCEDEPCEEYEQ